MAWHPSGHARVSATNPRAIGVCDDCGFQYNLDTLRPKQQWAGMKLQTYNFLVCKRCWDIPQQNLRTIIIPPDPMPVFNPRPEQYVAEVWTYATTQNDAVLLSEEGKVMVIDSSAADPEPPNV